MKYILSPHGWLCWCKCIKAFSVILEWGAAIKCKQNEWMQYIYKERHDTRVSTTLGSLVLLNISQNMWSPAVCLGKCSPGRLKPNVKKQQKFETTKLQLLVGIAVYQKMQFNVELMHKGKKYAFENSVLVNVLFSGIKMLLFMLPARWKQMLAFLVR